MEKFLSECLSYRFTGTRMLSKREGVGLIVWLEAGYDYRGDLGKGPSVSAMFRLSLTIAPAFRTLADFRLSQFGHVNLR